MRWKTNSKIKNLIALFPEFIGNNIYYFIQRKFGGLKKSDSLYFQNITASKKIWELIISSKKVPNDKVFFELGTGRVPEVPFYLWLMGADKTYTSDIQYLVRNNLISEFFKNVIKNEKVIRDELGEFLIEERISEFKNNFLTRKESELIEFMQSQMRIIYLPNLDARKTSFSKNTIDYYFSNNVFEHIYIELINDILIEQKRITKDDGLMINYIDYSDHFSHTDKSISSINFLQYDNNSWSKFAANRFIFMNRLRHDDFINFFEKHSYNCLITEINREADFNKIIEDNNFKFDEFFSKKSNNTLSILGSWFVHSN